MHMTPNPSELLLLDELARNTGASLRLIRLCETQGLIVPVAQGQHQVYSRHQRRRLQTILALRELGLAIKQIRAVFATYNVDDLSDLIKLPDFAQFLRDHAQQLKEQQDKITQQLAQVKVMLENMP
jgi:DNA-binding transcriptional MerR regulator